MEFIHKIQKIIHIKYYYCLGLLMLLATNTCLAQTIVISPNTVISHSKTYNNVTLDMTNGSFIIKNEATLTINNSIINGNLSEGTPLLINVDKGTLNLSNNQVNIKSIGITPHPTTQSLQYVIQVAMGGLSMTGNSFQIDQPFTAGLVITTASIPTTGINITNNNFERFHGVVYLLGTDQATISGNTLVKNTYGNLVIIGSNSKIVNNTIYFSGNNRLGNSIDVIDSNDVIVSNNMIFTPTCHGIYVFNSRDITLDSNRISGGITYGMNILSYPETLTSDEYLTNLIRNHKFNNLISSNITVTNNYMSQNRYGIAVSDVDTLTVQNNIFIQRFEDNDARKFWTNNNALLQNVTNLTWLNNQYKEAFSQEENGNNSNSNSLVPFPQSGGVSF
jgi:parallel beta-helix repeat protein